MLTPFRGTTETEGFNLAKQHGDTEIPVLDEMTDSKSTLGMNGASMRQRSRNKNGHIRVEEPRQDSENNDQSLSLPQISLSKFAKKS